MTVGLDPVLQAVELPARVADLATGLTDVDRDTLTLKLNKLDIEIRKIDKHKGCFCSFYCIDNLELNEMVDR